MHKFYTEDLRTRASVVITTDLIRYTKKLLGAFPLATMGLGRLLTGTVLFASQTAEKQSLSIRFSGDGVLGELIAEASFEGLVRAYCPNPDADVRTESGHLDLRTGIGRGIITVARTLPFQKEPHVGIVPIQSGEIAEDLVYYMAQSQQIPSILSVSVSLDPLGNIRAAGGVFIEVMPGASEALISSLEKNAQQAPHLSEKLMANLSPEELLKPYLHDSKIILADVGPALVYSCRCSPERVERTLILLGRATLAEMALKGDPVEMKCEFCGKKYSVPNQRVKDLIKEIDLPH